MDPQRECGLARKASVRAADTHVQTIALNVFALVFRIRNDDARANDGAQECGCGTHVAFKCVKAAREARKLLEELGTA